MLPSIINDKTHMKTMINSHVQFRQDCPKQLTLFIKEFLYHTQKYERPKQVEYSPQTDQMELQMLTIAMKYITQWRLKKLVFGPENAPQLFMTISHIDFTHTTHFVLHTNHIQNIQALSFLNAPMVEHLDLDANYITSLKPLAKCEFLQMRFLEIVDNNFQFHQLKSFSRFKGFLQDWTPLIKRPNKMTLSFRTNTMYLNEITVKLPKIQQTKLQRHHNNECRHTYRYFKSNSTLQLKKKLAKLE